MSWEKTLKSSTCKVSECYAYNCVFNTHHDKSDISENRRKWDAGQCTLDSITISSPDYGPQCDMFQGEKNRSETNFSRGQKSLIDRATRNLKEQEGKQ